MKRLIAFALVAMPVLALSLVRTAADPEPLSKELKQTTVDTLLASMKSQYVFPELATKTETTIREKLKSGAYDGITEGQVFAKTLTSDINAIIKDAHFHVSFSKQPFPPRKEATQPSEAEINKYKEDMRRQNAGIESAQRLMGNIGYIEVRSFMFTEALSDPLKAAFDMVANTDALIIDVRRNGGGDPAAVQMVCSYLFGETPVHLNDIYDRPSNKTEEFWTLAKVEGKRYLDKDVYVLTSKGTGSGAEEFAYNLQNLKRATIVGDVTWGGANPGGVHRLNDHFSAFIPSGRAINPITKTNWEGTGVTPDVKTTPELALKTAHLMAAKALIAKAKSDEEKAYREAIVKQLEATS